MKKIFLLSFEGRWLGGSSVILANDEEHARSLLKWALSDKGWCPIRAGEVSAAAKVVLWKNTQDSDVICLNDGDY